MAGRNTKNSKLQNQSSILAGVLIMLLLYLGAFVFLGQDARAQSDSIGCYSSEESSYTSMVQLPAGGYQVYVRIAASEPVRVSVGVEELSLDAPSDCQRVGAVTLEPGERWQYVGDITTTNTDENHWNTSVGVADDNVGSALLPSLLYLPIGDKSPCSDPNVCMASYQGKSYNLFPKKLSLSSDSLKVALLSQVSDDTKLKKAIFYEDGKIVRISTDSTEFDERLAFPGEHILRTDLLLEDGQVLTTSKPVDVGFEIQNFIVALITRYSSTLKSLGGVLLFLVIYFLGYALIAKYLRYRRWKSQHIITSNSREQAIPYDPTQRYEMAMSKARHRADAKTVVGIVTVPFALLALLFTVDSLAIGIFTVDGVSMETTLTDRSKLPLYKLPVTFTSFNNTGYLPARGEVVVVEVDENNLFEDPTEVKKSYVVKRTIGLPGDRVVVKDGAITIYNDSKPAGFDPDKQVYWESVIVPSIGRYIDVKLSDGEIFIIGDNRDNSIDSRNYGPIKTTQVVGTVIYSKSVDNLPYSGGY